MATTEKKENKVKLKIPRFAGKAEDDVLIGVNGVNYLIPRGKTVEVPDFVAAEYERSEEAKEAYFRVQDEKLSAANNISGIENNAG